MGYVQGLEFVRATDDVIDRISFNRRKQIKET